MFGQARKAAESASNRHSENIIKTIMLRLQAKKQSGHTLHSVNEADSVVSKAAANLPTFSRTRVKKNYILSRKHSWQAHLERISPFLVQEQEWWADTLDGYEFKDAETDPDTSVHGPSLMHFTTATLSDVRDRQVRSWKVIADQQVPLPAPSIILYPDEAAEVLSH